MQVKEAVQKAKQYLPEVFESAAGQDLELEGVEFTEGGETWQITFSYTDKLHMGRDYKTVKLSNADGKFLGARNGFLLDAF